MFQTHDIANKFALACGLVLAVFAPPDGADANDFSVLYTFTGASGSVPYGALVADTTGNFYSTTCAGGADNQGTVFELAPDGTETVLYSFAGGSDGSCPYTGLLADKSGNLYGTTFAGGIPTDCAGGCGTVFKLTGSGGTWNETVLYRFTGGNDGANPGAGALIADRKGNLYGTTHDGGSYGFGVVFKVASNGAETVLYTFTGGNDGGYPFGGVIRDKTGDLYGTTEFGGADTAGTLFKIAPDGTETTLYTFCSQPNCVDGGNPSATPIIDSNGNLFGATFGGGSGTCPPMGGPFANGCGTIYKLAPNDTETVLFSFAGSPKDGAQPNGVIADKAGNLYGTAYEDGTTSTGCSGYGCGTIFRVAPDGTETTLYFFTGGSDGGNPGASLILLKGTLYGTASTGGADKDGTVFAINK